jgi:hypothetical protein
MCQNNYIFVNKSDTIRESPCIFRNNCPVKCHFERPPNQQIRPIEFFSHFHYVYGNLFYTVVRR